MIRRRPLHYFSALLVLLVLGAAANVQFVGDGRASGRRGNNAEIPSDLAEPGHNAFANRVRRGLDLAFYEDFMSAKRASDAGFGEDKTGQWSNGAAKGVAAYMNGKGPDLETASDIASVLAMPSGVHAGGPLAPVDNRLTTPGLATVAPIVAGPLILPGVVPSGFAPPRDLPPPPIAEVPAPPAALLFASALGLTALRRRRPAAA